MSYPMRKVELFMPDLEELVEIYQTELPEYFKNVEVGVVPCPNLKEEPFFLSGEGICGRTCLADVGGVPYLTPFPQRSKIFDLKDVVNHSGIIDGLVIGAGAGPFHQVGVNCELMANVKFDEKISNNSYIAKLDEDGGCTLEKLNSTEFGLLGNFFISEGKRGRVLHIRVSKRVSNENYKDFVTIMREILVKHFGNVPIGMGGTFIIAEGSAKLHVMPDFSTTALKSNDDVNRWLKFYQFKSPLVALSCFITKDPGLDLRLQHTHCFSNHGKGGHYHNDTTPSTVEYLAYFNIAEEILRIDPPEFTHNVGRD